MPLREQLELLLSISAVAFVAAFWILLQRRRGPIERERRRRLNVNLRGRLGDAMITDVQDNTIYYSYNIRGVAYTAAQDISTIREFLPEDTERLIGLASLKYHTNNPANSILVCEKWSGLRVPLQEPSQST